MGNRRYKDGRYIDVPVPADVTAGDVVTVGLRALVFDHSFPANATDASAAAEGEYLMDKAVGALAEGIVIYWDETAGNVTVTGPADGKLGQTSAAALSADTQVRVLLGP